MRFHTLLIRKYVISIQGQFISVKYTFLNLKSHKIRSTKCFSKGILTLKVLENNQKWSQNPPSCNYFFLYLLIFFCGWGYKLFLWLRLTFHTMPIIWCEEVFQASKLDIKRIKRRKHCPYCIVRPLMSI